MVRSQRVPTVFVAALLVASFLGGPAAALTPEEAQPEPDTTVTRIELTANGSATWIVRVRTRLETDAEVREFERFQASFRGNESRSLERFRGRITGVVRNAANATGREMRATDFAASTSVQEVPRRWGVVTYRFHWRNFARVDGDRIVAGDVFDGGFYIAESDSLEVVAPVGFRIASADPDPTGTDGRTVTWEGPESFAGGRPHVVAEPVPESTAPSTGESTPPNGADTSEFGGFEVAIAALALSALAVGAVLYARRESAVPNADASSQTVSVASGVEGTADGEDPLVTDDDRVVALLRERGGRLKQADVADAFDWSSSKTSRVVGELTDENRVEKLRIGRENVIQLPDGDAGDDESDGGR